jgi:type I restriction enzyme S subunit
MTACPFVPLGEVVTHRKQFVQIEDSKLYKLCRVQWYGQGVILRGTVLGLEVKTKAQQICRAGEFLVAEIDAKEGGLGVVPPDLEGAIVSGHYFLFEVDQTRLDTRYLGHYIQTTLFRGQVKAQGSTNYSAIRPSDVCSYMIPLPPIEEQRRIVERLATLETKIQRATRLHEESVRMTDLLLYSEARTIRERLTLQWPTRPLSDITLISSGGTPARSNPNFWQDGTIPWVKTGELRDCDIADSEEKITPIAVESTNAKLFPPETVLIAMYGQGQTRGRTGILKVAATTNQACAAILPRAEAFTSKYLQYWLRSLYHEMRQENRGGAQPNWNAGMIGKICLATPPLGIQYEVIKRLEQLENHQQGLQKRQNDITTELNAVISSALGMAFSGGL